MSVWTPLQAPRNGLAVYPDLYLTNMQSATEEVQALALAGITSDYPDLEEVDVKLLRLCRDNGGTVVIGGIFVQDERTEEQKVPFLGDVPVLGHLFKNTSRKSDRSELLIFLTPKVVSEKSALR